MWACYRTVFNYLEIFKSDIYNCVSLDNLPLSREPAIAFDDIEETNEAADYLETILEKMQLNKGQLETLNCYMSEMGFVETARFLSVNLSTVWRRRLQLQQIYIQKIAAVNY
ncbi:MAG: hypothetical protein PHW00_03735 [Clostridia bacterium]|nr:hypothetical protein [Clostridia bacterium]